MKLLVGLALNRLREVAFVKMANTQPNAVKEI